MVAPPPEMPRTEDASVQKVGEMARHHINSSVNAVQNLLDRGNLTRRSDELDQTVLVHTGPMVMQVRGLLRSPSVAFADLPPNGRSNTMPCRR